MRYIDEDTFPWIDAIDSANEYGKIRHVAVVKGLEGREHATGPHGAASRAIGRSCAR